jgi:hypothetical protein
MSDQRGGYFSSLENKCPPVTIKGQGQGKKTPRNLPASPWDLKSKAGVFSGTRNPVRSGLPLETSPVFRTKQRDRSRQPLRAVYPFKASTEFERQGFGLALCIGGGPSGTFRHVAAMLANQPLPRPVKQRIMASEPPGIWRMSG